MSGDFTGGEAPQLVHAAERPAPVPDWVTRGGYSPSGATWRCPVEGCGYGIGGLDSAPDDDDPYWDPAPEWTHMREDHPGHNSVVPVDGHDAVVGYSIARMDAQEAIVEAARAAVARLRHVGHWDLADLAALAEVVDTYPADGAPATTPAPSAGTTDAADTAACSCTPLVGDRHGRGCELYDGWDL